MNREPEGATPRDLVFVSYSHKDSRWLELVKTHLKPFERKGILYVWNDQRIRTGAPWRDEVMAALSRTRVAVLLVSPDFLASDFIAKHELPKLLSTQKEVTVVWIPIRPSSYRATEIGEYQAAIDPQRTLAEMDEAEADRALVIASEKIADAFGSLPLMDQARPDDPRSPKHDRVSPSPPVSVHPTESPEQAPTATAADNRRRGVLKLLDASQNQLAFCHLGIYDPKVQQIQLLKDLSDILKAGGGLDLRYHYLGPVCARHWIDLSTDARYGRLEAQERLKQIAPFVTDAVKRSLLQAGPVGAASLVSLGCGDGALDRVLLELLLAQQLPIQGYFPVDISPELLQCAAQAVRTSPALNSIGVITVLADLDQLERVAEIWPTPPHVELYTLLGYTFGNFRPEVSLMRRIARLMGPEDFLLIDARCYVAEIQDLKSPLGRQVRDELAVIYNHEANARFASGPLSFRTQRVPNVNEIGYEVRFSTRSVVPNSLTVDTMLRLDDAWRKELGIGSSNTASLLLAWSTVYSEATLDTWFTPNSFETVRTWQWQTSTDSLLKHKVYLLRVTSDNNYSS